MSAPLSLCSWWPSLLTKGVHSSYHPCSPSHPSVFSAQQPFLILLEVWSCSCFFLTQSIPMAFCVLRIKVKFVVEISKILYFISTSPSNLSLSHPLPAPCWIPCASHQLHICHTTFTLPNTAAVVLDPQVACVSYSLPLLVLTCPLTSRPSLTLSFPLPNLPSTLTFSSYLQVAYVPHSNIFSSS